MKIFLTGATGFIGSHFVNACHEAGYGLLCIKRKRSKPRIPLMKQPEWIDGGLDDEYSGILKRCDILVHLAAHSANVPYDTLENCIYWNLTVPLKLFKQAVNAGIREFIIAGTCFEYGKSGERYKFIPPNAPLEPTMSYPASKAAASIAFSQFAIEHNLRLQYLRIFQVYGEGEHESRLWPSLRKKALTGEDYEMTPGEQIRDFISVDDVCQQFIKALKRSVVSGIPYIKNIGSGQPQTVLEFASLWWEKWRATGQLKPGKFSYRPNEILRFVPEVDL